MRPKLPNKEATRGSEPFSSTHDNKGQGPTKEYQMADITKLVDQLSELTVLEAADLAKALAALPSLDELRATIVGLIQAPASKIARTINEPGAQLARVFGAYAAQAA
jgi:ribosomal protein L10